MNKNKILVQLIFNLIDSKNIKILLLIMLKMNKIMNLKKQLLGKKKKYHQILNKKVIIIMNLKMNNKIRYMIKSKMIKII